MLSAKIVLERLDKFNHPLEKREQKSFSFVRQFIQTLYLQVAQIVDGGYSISDTGGAARAVDGDGGAGFHWGKGNFLIGSPGGNAALLVPTGNYFGNRTQYFACLMEAQYIGIQVGSSNAAVLPTQTGMSTRIAHGVGAGQIEYGGCELRNLAFANPNGSFDIRRYFTNSSGGDVTVRESGIYGAITRGDEAVSQAVWSAMFVRDVVAPDLVVADTELLRATYTIQITV